MGTVILGWIMIAIGLLAVLAGIGGGVAKMFKEITAKADRGEGRAIGALPTDVLKALQTFLEALSKSPIWLALIIIGFALIAWGGTLI